MGGVVRERDTREVVVVRRRVLVLQRHDAPVRCPACVLVSCHEDAPGAVHRDGLGLVRGEVAVAAVPEPQATVGPERGDAPVVAEFSARPVERRPSGREEGPRVERKGSDHVLRPVQVEGGRPADGAVARIVAPNPPVLSIGVPAPADVDPSGLRCGGIRDVRPAGVLRRVPQRVAGGGVEDHDAPVDVCGALPPGSVDEAVARRDGHHPVGLRLAVRPVPERAAVRHVECHDAPVEGITVPACHSCLRPSHEQPAAVRRSGERSVHRAVRVGAVPEGRARGGVQCHDTPVLIGPRGGVGLRTNHEEPSRVQRDRIATVR